MTTTHLPGFPRIGAKRELKILLESYWKRDICEAELLAGARELRQRHWLLQKGAGVDLPPVGDFSLYDHVLDAQLLVGAAPARFGFAADAIDTERYFQLARGNASQPALEMTKWFDTNYHYLVPEWQTDTAFRAQPERLLGQVREALALGVRAKPVLLGPLSLLWLGKCKGRTFERLQLLPGLLAAYRQILAALREAGVEWVQIDEPILALDLPPAWLDAFPASYRQLQADAPAILLASYFGGVAEHADLLKALPVAGLHLDLARAPQQLSAFLAGFPADKVLSAGVIDGRNVWRADLSAILRQLQAAHAQLGDRLWLAPSCSLLHSPFDLAAEIALAPDIKAWLAFAVQKLNELRTLQRGLRLGRDAIAGELAGSDFAQQQKQHSPLIHLPGVRQRIAALPAGADRRASPYPVRAPLQQAWLRLPPLPTTTIGSFPQTAAIRASRAAYKRGELAAADYQKAMEGEIELAIRRQEALGLDVLVHGEAERNDMVEYFGEQLSGFAFTAGGWVQSYGSRCVKPPILYGDVSRPAAMTVDWARYAQSLTAKPVKGMLTGPVTILQWSFVRDDLPRSEVCRQIALALNDEVRGLEAAGIRVIQIDEPAIREGLPLKRADRDGYLAWAGQAFRLSCHGVDDATQIHTHMCYSEFGDILPAIAALDADVITIETSRSDMALLADFSRFRYPNAIGPGVYDIHSPRVPAPAEIRQLLEKALQVIPAAQLWVNPDCGLKTRDWPEVEAALAAMVQVGRELREEIAPAV
ncbi:5-methyltetrahydropteroyltriglutamate--homocysteine S-methyltransferase [Chromobacterium subtsugae]|mgnify:CR=1 FL=1|uniref:5-methyltetrahydropteroyltriglutamate--homocysteine methyltransferase n=2 Tax=Chromobacterium subtsugae TaxID=251747 RepID=A0ABS7FDP6_9NEIS|nr:MULTISPECIES: 5-methyltetrahydropteroyltriglutamate--homocysteine S-methyltransferase [Chromobacterium]KUM02410.1 5-methyltetrahydropteroyltriglutamate--homocysteine methyltransferase [Chromobacterium subtsugae]KZE86853.1 5-methyltetrahydropteroyltriglutamate--homocysteine methyltransferase [Chromobacterium sp. F49]MBW7566896.1 5-methyltetrahydropteroyltriglutamate--homocysteine S-methyltransferase [Chromobacterium subtsugae]MBW8288200.1 5-methyltetrahydropteroyltriglutamate--homocysteine S-